MRVLKDENGNVMVSLEEEVQNVSIGKEKKEAKKAWDKIRDEKMRIKFLTRLFNRLLMGEQMPEEWRSVLIPIYKNKGDAQCC